MYGEVSSGTNHYTSIWSEYGTGSLVLAGGLKSSTTAADFIYPYTGTYGYAAIELDSFHDDGIKFYTAADAARTAGAVATKQERMRIDTSGNVGIGTTSNLSTAKLDVRGNIYSQGYTFSKSGALVGANITLTNQAGDASSNDVTITASHSTNSIVLRAAQKVEFYTYASGAYNNRLTIANNGTVNVTGTFTAGTKSFLIDHPTKENHMLQYGSLEGPEFGVYVRGKTDLSEIELPEVWIGLVREGSITVSFTPRGKFLPLFLNKIENNTIYVGGTEGGVFYDYVIYGTRKDVDDLVTEFTK